MKSIRSHRNRSDIFDPEDVDPEIWGQEEQRLAMAATAETLQKDRGVPKRIRMSAMTEL